MTAQVSPPATGDTTTRAAPVVLRITEFKYELPISVRPGAKITITNSDKAAHTVTADKGGAFDVDVDGGGGTATLTAPSKPGRYPFHCIYHPNMHGILVVS